MTIHAATPLRLVLLAGLLLGGCDGASGPNNPLGEDELTFLRATADAPPLSHTEVSFYAVPGETREVEIRYADGNGYEGKCFLLRIPARALPGADSVLVTVRVVDPELFIFEIHPAGLAFDPDYPAELEVRYEWAELGEDRVRERFGIWKEVTPGRWARVETMRLSSPPEARAMVREFTRYALASD